MFARAGKAVLALGLLLATAAIAAQDPLANLSHDASAVLLSADGPHVLLNEEEYGVLSTRTLGIGDEYRDGWIIRGIDAAVITLAKDGQTRQVRPLGARAAPVPAASPVAAAVPAPAAAVAKIGSSNAGLGAGGAQANMEAAIAAGDVARVTALGGTGAEIGLAKFAQMDKQRLQMLKAGDKSAPVRAINPPR